MKRIDRLLEQVLGGLLALMVLDVTWQILTRFLPMSPSSYTEELARYLLVWIGILGAAYAYRKKSHLGIDLLTNALPEGLRRKVQLLTISMCFVFAAATMVFGGIQLVMLTFELNQLSAALSIPMGYVYSVIPLSGTLICLFSADQLVQVLSGKSAAIDDSPQSTEMASAQGQV
ncbi:TRAP transporter small permease [Microbulbifer donghaiensis]|nr:TRAP transporter small permease [Microbulbifer donghaiensis]